jgi:pyruvate/2-oxoglutarate/acetoin dehydrogenase E1 component
MRVAENLNQALHTLFAEDSRAYLLGEDVKDPYGGAFKITKGLSSRYPDRVLSTPISESAIVGAAAGLALAGDTAIAEIMFGDFAALAFDQLLNFASKSVTMYGRRHPLRLIVRCPVGGGRGYGPTHSQSLQKHFVGIPNLSLFELSPVHDNTALLRDMLDRAEPGLLFEDKTLYGAPMYRDGIIDDLFGYDLLDARPPIARISPEGTAPDCLLIAAGGLVGRSLRAMRALLLEDDIACHLLVPARLHPFDVESVLALVRQARTVCVVEESTAGGTWGAEVAHLIHQQAWARLRGPVRLVHSADRIIPAAEHLERSVLVQHTTIQQAVTEALA